jgi:tetratricopeptide (TPR) repeat protein
MSNVSGTISDPQLDLISGGLGAAPLKRSESGALQPVLVDSDNAKIHIVLYPELDFSVFERALQSCRTLGFISQTRAKLENFVFGAAVLLFTVLVVVFIGLLAVYQDLFSASIIDSAFGSRYRQMLLAGSALLAIIVINYLPSFFTAEKSWLKNRLLQWQNQEYRVRRKLKRDLSALQSKGQFSLSVWNLSIAEEQPWIWSYLIPVLVEVKQSKTFYLSTEKEDLTLGKLKALLPDVLNDLLIPSKYPGYDTPVAIETVVAMLGRKDRSLLKILQQTAGTICPDNDLQDIRLNGIRLESIIPYELYTYLVKLGWRASVGVDNENVEQVVSAFFQQLKDNYGLLDSVFSHNKIYHYFTNTLFTESLYQWSADGGFSLADYRADLQLFVRQSQEPVSVVAAINLLADCTQQQTVADRCSDSLIIQVRDRELYFLADILHYYLVGSQAELTAEDCRGCSLDALDALLEIFERSGNYADALILAEQLSKINRVHYRMIKARLLERQGKFLEAYEILSQLGKDYFDKQKLLNFDALELDLSFRLHLSWTIVSGRLIACQHAGKEAMSTAQKHIATLAGNTINPYLLWRYFNNRANYAEWDSSFTAAAKFHEEALTIPGIEQKWISGTYTNLGIIYRLLLEQSLEPDYFNKSIGYLSKGLEIKTQIGDEDELPITLHNYALTLLTNFRLNATKKKNINQVHKAYSLAMEGLNILARTNSSKKKGVLLAEAWIASIFLKQRDEGFVANQGDPPIDLTSVRTCCPADQYAEVATLLSRFEDLLDEVNQFNS